MKPCQQPLTGFIFGQCCLWELGIRLWLDSVAVTKVKTLFLFTPSVPLHPWCSSSPLVFLFTPSVPLHPGMVFLFTPGVPLHSWCSILPHLTPRFVRNCYFFNAAIIDNHLRRMPPCTVSRCCTTTTRWR